MREVSNDSQAQNNVLSIKNNADLRNSQISKHAIQACEIQQVQV